MENDTACDVWTNKTILITGGTGSLGKGLIRRINGAKELRIFSRDEERQLQLKQQNENGTKNIKFILGDVRDFHSVLSAVRGCDLVIHAAAHKFLNLAEKQPRECALINVSGSINVVDACVYHKIPQAIAISTDKVAYARNVYGCSKHIMEKVFQEADYNWVRYGNVIGTTGSVIEIWKDSLKRNGTISITDERMRRFFFTVDDAIDLIEKCIITGQNCIPKMKAARIYDLALAFINEDKDRIKYIGLRPGEKLDEVLVADYEGEELTTANAELMTMDEIKEMLNKINQQS